ncbi:hypothetical protein BpHYR1_006094 [Brachionus plicatilis]|uniref:Uncharacterized protein n=1 Tax=Brachionus plicatilis TaxID=10195 RepID=A0A3M7SFH5_BRAPC|nr:hypothetical protein BpHYR1_006094 [Brachionus plicatilis]
MSSSDNPLRHRYLPSPITRSSYGATHYFISIVLDLRSLDKTKRRKTTRRKVMSSKTQNGSKQIIKKFKVERILVEIPQIDSINCIT